MRHRGQGPGNVPVKGERCYLAGPLRRSHELKSAPLPKGVSFSQGKVVTVPQGWVVLQAANPNPSDTIKATVRRRSTSCSRPTGADGQADLQPDREHSGGEPTSSSASRTEAEAFQNVTGQIAHRGQQVSIGNDSIAQHFAAALDGQLLSVPQIDFNSTRTGSSTPAPTAGA